MMTKPGPGNKQTVTKTTGLLATRLGVVQQSRHILTNTVTYSITWHADGDGGCILPRKATNLGVFSSYFHIAATARREQEMGPK